MSVELLLLGCTSPIDAAVVGVVAGVDVWSKRDDYHSE